MVEDLFYMRRILQNKCAGDDSLIRQIAEGSLNFACSQLKNSLNTGCEMTEWLQAIRELRRGNGEPAWCKCVHFAAKDSNSSSNRVPSKVQNRVNDVKHVTKQSTSKEKGTGGWTNYRRTMETFLGYHYGRYFHPTTVQRTYDAFEQGM